ncbi:MAG: type II secretion system F family protein [Candidatus Diapherotrites archaeon]|nr:type II secretion system F family protein [Candidatus Diapherotrites archaeon]
MKDIHIPFSPLPLPVLLKLAKNTKGIGYSVAKCFPYLEVDLKQADIDIEKEDYGSIIFLISVFYFVFLFVLFCLISLKYFTINAIIFSLTLSLLFTFLIIIQLTTFPKITLLRKTRDIERNLVFALRAMLVEIRGGVSLYDALVTISKGNFGEVSKEFSKALEKINTGYAQEDALEEIASKNPSIFFRRSIWQIVNGLKAGSDISDVINSSIDFLTKEQRNQIRNYGNRLRVLSLIYMMLGVIIPALGLTFLVILSSFPQLGINEFIFWVFFGVIVISQFMYLGIIKSSRPTLLAE